MTPERIARLVAWWVRRYTRGLPDAVARRRTEEIAADLHDEIAHGRAHGAGERRIAAGLASRMVRGLAADASWRRHARASRRPAGARAPLRRSLIRVGLATLALLALALLTMPAWTAFDVAAAAVVLGGMGLLLELALRRGGELTYRAAAGLALAAALMLIWLVGAVGVIGVDGDRADLVYGGVLAVGIAGAALARLRPRGMARALGATALAQVGVTVVALAAGRHEAAVTSAAELVGLNAIFVALFLASAGLFRRAGRRPPAAGGPPEG